MNVRDAALADLDMIVHFNLALASETEDLALDPAVVRAGVKRVLTDPALGRYWVAEEGGAVIGQIMVTYEWSDWRNGPMWWIQSVFVESGHRRRGVFRALYAAVKARALESGATALRLYVVTENTRAQETYRSMGMYRTDYVVMHGALAGPSGE